MQINMKPLTEIGRVTESQNTTGPKESIDGKVTLSDKHSKIRKEKLRETQVYVESEMQ